MLINTKNVDYTKEPIFLGEKLGLQRYDRFKYPAFFDLFNKQTSFTWRPEEVSIQLDRAQYKELEEHEKFIFTKNLLFQTMLDSVVSRGVPVFTQYVSNPELELCMNTWAFFENIHSYSYTYIIKNVYSDPSKILDQAFEDKEILARAASVTKAYDELENAKLNIKEKIYLALISVNILEAIRFYVSFVCAFAFGENKKMVGNADIIKLIKRDENCHLAISQTVINILRKEESEGFTDIISNLEDKAIEMFLHGAEEEKRWASYLFKDGSILGLNEQVMHQYIEWLVDSRMKQLGLPKQFGTKNPIKGWIEPWMESAKLQVAPQETEITSYKVGANISDMKNLDIKFEL